MQRLSAFQYHRASCVIELHRNHKEKHHMQGPPPCQGQSVPALAKKAATLLVCQMLSAPCHTITTSPMLLIGARVDDYLGRNFQ